jgi:hypothetical protein
MLEVYHGAMVGAYKQKTTNANEKPRLTPMCEQQEIRFYDNHL